MLIHEEQDPPQDDEAEKIKNFLESIKNKNYLNKYSFLASIYTQLKRLYAVVASALSLLFSSFEKISAPKNLPHIAILAVFLVVFVSNTGDKMIARAYTEELNTLEPAEAFSIIQGVDDFTPLLKDEDIAVDEAQTVKLISSGFDISGNTVTTNITEREEPLPDNSSATVYYVVRAGDTLTALSIKFGVKLATIKYLNDIDNINLVRPGTKLKVPKRGYEVPASQIAKKEAEKRRTVASASVVNARATNAKLAISRPAGAQNNGYPWGWCTYYVATRRYVPVRWGNAKYWLNSARKAGYATGRDPVPGSIYVSTYGWGGHVAYVEEVYSDGSYKISEMNGWAGWGRIGSRVIKEGDRRTSGFVY